MLIPRPATHSAYLQRLLLHRRAHHDILGTPPAHPHPVADIVCRLAADGAQRSTGANAAWRNTGSGYPAAYPALLGTATASQAPLQTVPLRTDCAVGHPLRQRTSKHADPASAT